MLGLSFGYKDYGIIAPDRSGISYVSVPSTYNVEYNVTSDLTGKVYHRKYVSSYYSIPAKPYELNYFGLVIPIEEMELWKARVKEVFGIKE